MLKKHSSFIKIRLKTILRVLKVQPSKLPISSIGSIMERQWGFIMNLSKNKVLFLFVISAFVILFNTGCSRKVQDSSILQISLPAGMSSKITEFKYSEPMSMQSVSVQSEDNGAEWNSALNPETIADVNCYMIAVSGPESDMSRNTCVTTTGQNLKVGRFVGGIAAGATLSLEVPSGSQREITIVGFKATAGACTNFKTTDVSGLSLSEPHILGKIIKDLSPGSVAVTVPVTVNATTLKIDDCSGPDFNFEHAPLYFGDKTIANGTDTIITSTTYAGLGGASFQVTNFNTQPANPNEAYTFIQTSAFPTGIAVDDEVMLTIQGQSGAWTMLSGVPTIGPCGYRAWDGRYQFGRVVAVTSTPNYGIYISKGTFFDKLDWNPAISAFDPAQKSAIVTHMAASPDPANVFCKMRISKVLHFYNLTITNGVTISPDMFELNMGNSGILPIRVANNLTMLDGAIIDGNGKGYMGNSTRHGSGTRGASSVACVASPTDTGSGGSCSPDARGAGGGGHGNPIGTASPYSGSGGTGGGGTQLGGQGAGDDCGDGSCFGFLTYKMFMGGAGGSSINSLASTGGSGGGIIYIMAKNLNVDTNANVIISNNGDDGQSNTTYANYGSGGGGAGGSTLLGFQNFTAPGTAQMDIQAYGGNGGLVSGTATNGSGGGGGGGGRVHIIGCNTSTIPVTSALLNLQLNGGSGGNSLSGGSVGSAGYSGSVVKQSVPCN